MTKKAMRAFAVMGLLLTASTTTYSSCSSCADCLLELSECNASPDCRPGDIGVIVGDIMIYCPIIY